MKHREFLLLAATGGVTNVRVEFPPDVEAWSMAGCSVVVMCEQKRGQNVTVGRHVLMNDRGRPRRFASIDTVAKYLRALGIEQFEVKMSIPERSPEYGEAPVSHMETRQ